MYALPNPKTPYASESSMAKTARLTRAPRIRFFLPLAEVEAKENSLSVDQLKLEA